MEVAQIDVLVKDSVFDPNLSADPTQAARARHTVYVKFRDAQPLYKVWLYLEGRDLPYVESVTYLLPQQLFDPAERTVRRELTNQNCQLIIWTPGYFPVRASIRDKLGRVYDITRELSYGRELELPDLHYEKVEDDSRPVLRGTGGGHAR